MEPIRTTATDRQGRVYDVAARPLLQSGHERAGEFALYVKSPQWMSASEHYGRSVDTHCVPALTEQAAVDAAIAYIQTADDADEWTVAQAAARAPQALVRA